MLVVIGSTLALHADGGALAWVKRAGGNNIDEGNAVAVDSKGNVFATGYFKSTATFGAGDLDPTVLAAQGQDVFIAKYASGGGLLWVRQARAIGGWGTGIAADPLGNAYLCGYFSNSITFGTNEASQVTLNALANDIFVAKYDSEGNFIWARKAGGTFSDFANGIAVDKDGNCYVTGQYGSNPLIFAASESNETQLPGIGNNGEDIFMASYDPNGAFRWAKSAGGSSGTRGAGIGVDASGNSYVVGHYSGTCTFGAGEPNQTALVAPVGGRDEIFLAKFSTNGALVWVRGGEGEADHDRGTSIAVDAAGNSFTTGLFGSKPPFGAQLNQAQLAMGGTDGIFVAKHDTQGNVQWVKLAVGSDSNFALGIALDPEGNSYVTGYGSGILFGAEEPGEVGLGGSSPHDIFMAKFAPDGLLQWARIAGGNSDDRGQGIAASADAVYVIGRFGLTATFGRDEAKQTSITTGGSTDIFLAKFQSGASVSIQPATFTAFQLLSGGHPLVTISGSAEKTYSIQRTSSLLDATWTNVGSVTLDAQGKAGFEDSDDSLLFPAFYRVVGN